MAGKDINYMKRLIIFCLLCSCLVLTSCGSKSEDSQETKAASEAEETGENTDSAKKNLTVETNEASVTVEEE